MKFYLKGSVSELHPKGPSTAPEEDLMYKPCKSGSPNELDVSPQGDQSFFICMRVCVCDRGGGNRGDIIEMIKTFLNNFLSLFKMTMVH